MDIQKEEKFEALPEIEMMLRENPDIKFENGGYVYHGLNQLTAFAVCYVAGAWMAWQAAKAQAVPAGFVVVEKSDLTDTYYWDGSEYVVDCPSDYEMELEQGEVITLEKWQRTKSTNVHFANIYTDEDNFDIVQFKTLEEAEQAIAENIAMIEAQEPAND